MNQNTNVALAAAFVLAVGIIPAALGCIVDAEVGDGQPSFVNEVSTVEIAYANSAKSLDCAAVNFCNITWYKDGIPFPWTPQEETVTHHLEKKSQFVRFKSADVADEGEYVCVVSNGVQLINRTIRFVVLEDPRRPFFLGENGGYCADQTVAVGGTVHFDCEFSVGKDRAAQSFAGWSKVSKGEDTPVEWIEDIETHTSQTYRNDNIIVAHLKIVDIKENGFGIWKVYVYHDGWQTKAALSVHREKVPSDVPDKRRIGSLLEKIKRPKKETF